MLFTIVNLHRSPLQTRLPWPFPVRFLDATAITTVDRSLCGVARTLRDFKIANLSLVSHTLASVDDSPYPRITDLGDIKQIFSIYNVFTMPIGHYPRVFIKISNNEVVIVS
jgi:hypothetical protein